MGAQLAGRKLSQGTTRSGSNHPATVTLAALTIQRRMPDMACPATLGTALLFTALDAFAWTSNGPSIRYLIVIGGLLVAFAVDGALAGPDRRLHPSVVVTALGFGLWTVCVHLVALTSGTWAPDTLVILAGAGALLVAPAAYYALPARVGWRERASKIFTIAVVTFVMAALLNAVLTPWGEQANLLGHEKAFLAVLVLSLPNTGVSIFCKVATLLGLLVAFAKYPSATVGFVVLVAGICFWLLKAKNRASLTLRFLLLSTCTGLLLGNSSDLIGRFYDAMGRGDNTDTRLGLWDQAMSTVSKSPIVGSAASEPITGLANIRGIVQPVPFHNSFLSLAVSGGLVALVLFLLLIFAVVANSMPLDDARLAHARLWFPTLAAGLVTMSVNPVLEKLGNAIPIYALFFAAAVDVVGWKLFREACDG